jgi:hypothetical protein
MDMKQNQILRPHRAVYFYVFFLSFLILSVCPLFVQAETLVPLHVQKGTNLIHIARQYCSKQSDWPTIAKINHLKSPYVIRTNSTLQIPLSILRTKDVSAQVASINGSPQLVTGDSQILELHKGDRVLPGQTIVTDKDEYVHLVYPDHKHTRIGPQTEMTLSYLMRLTDNNLKAEFSLKKGRITHNIQQKLKANEHFDTRTAIAITGIRGTEFRIKVEDSDTNIVETLKGKVVLSAAGKQLVLDKGMGSKVNKGKPPGPPRTLPGKPDLPHIEEVYRTLPVVIAAPAHENAKSIRIRVTADKEGQTTLLEQIAEPGQNFTLLTLTDGHYYVFLTAIDNTDFESLPSSPTPLYIRTIPAAPLISKPNSGLQTFDSSITISWLQSDLARQYNIQLATDADFSVLIDEQQTKDTSYTTAALSPGLYFFRVQLVAEDGFETLFSPPLTWEVVEQPKLGSMDSLSQGEDGMTLQWSAIENMSGYMIQVAADKKFSDLVAFNENLRDPSYTITNDLPPGDYYIRICAVMSNGQKSPWTQTQTLTIDPAPLGIKHFFIGLGFIALILI